MKNIILLVLLLTFLSTGNLWAQQPSRFEENTETENSETNEETNQRKTGDAKSPALPRTRSTFADRMRYGGNLGLQFGSVTIIDLNPRAYYLLTEKMALGAGVSYSYVKYSNNYPYQSVRGLETNNYGGQLFAWYEVFNPIILQVEYEALNWERYTIFTNPNTGDQRYESERVWNHNLFVGGGLRQRVGRGSVFFTFLYNLTYDQYNSPYSQPYVLRIGFGI